MLPMLPMGAETKQSDADRPMWVHAQRSQTRVRSHGQLTLSGGCVVCSISGPTRATDSADETSSTTLRANSLRAAAIYALLSSDASLYVLLQAVGELWLNIID